MTRTDLLVLHTLRCVGHAALPRVADTTGLARSEAESELIDLAVAGFVTRTAGEFGGWGLTPAGRAVDEQRIAAELEAAAARDTVAAAYQEFLVLNPELLELCTAWQMRQIGGVAVPNEHTDAGYDARVLGLFVAFDERAAVVCASLASALARFARYQVRLAQALARARAGERDYLADNMESYHVVWFQLHEDLLATLGLPRV